MRSPTTIGNGYVMSGRNNLSSNVSLNNLGALNNAS